MVNMAMTGEATTRNPQRIPLSSIGLTTRAVRTSLTQNMQGQQPDEFYNSMSLQGQQTWWLCLTTEIYDSIRQPTTTNLVGLRGNTFMPRFDKMILSADPGAAISTLAYHLTELHAETQQPTTWKLLSWTPEVHKLLQRLGAMKINIFNRAYCRPQLQLEAGHSIHFTTVEQASINTWDVVSTGDNNVLSEVMGQLSWLNNYLWTFNYVFSTTLVNNDINNDHNIVLLQALEYAGAQVINRLSQDERQRLWTILDSNQQWSGLKHIQMGGSKTTERLRGNPKIVEWVNNNVDFVAYINEYNQYRTEATDANMEEEEDQQG